jgi:hypothetical protein
MFRQGGPGRRISAIGRAPRARARPRVRVVRRRRQTRSASARWHRMSACSTSAPAPARTRSSPHRWSAPSRGRPPRAERLSTVTRVVDAESRQVAARRCLVSFHACASPRSAAATAVADAFAYSCGLRSRHRRRGVDDRVPELVERLSHRASAQPVRTPSATRPADSGCGVVARRGEHRRREARLGRRARAPGSASRALRQRRVRTTSPDGLADRELSPSSARRGRRACRCQRRAAATRPLAPPRTSGGTSTFAPRDRDAPPASPRPGAVSRRSRPCRKPPRSLSTERRTTLRGRTARQVRRREPAPWTTQWSATDARAPRQSWGAEGCTRHCPRRGAGLPEALRSVGVETIRACVGCPRGCRRNNGANERLGPLRVLHRSTGLDCARSRRWWDGSRAAPACAAVISSGLGVLSSLMT